ncbi:MAG TPA: ATP-binding cassette domain-containing protein [Terriglobales bacterium]|jgi:ABC-type polar amino acid transport system ATPase subunit|nr:ATP-binding cassette domain-containing protein [Terriglobales bacterium]
MNEAMLHLRGVNLSRGQRIILKGTTFSVDRGELVALMGPSGVGKTTVLRVIAGLETFQSGSVRVQEIALNGGNGHAPKTLQQLRARVGMVFQFHYLFEHLSVLKNVWLAPVHARGIAQREAEQRARGLLASLGVEHRATALPRELSGGEAQRVAIARALAVDPLILLLDEPTASLDAERRTELGDLLRGLIREGRTLVVATHDEDFARTCATRVLRVREGRVFEDSAS